MDSILRHGFADFRDYVNPVIYKRAEFAREPIRFARVVDGRLELEDGRLVEDFHGTQAFGHRHPYIAECIREFLASDHPNWFPSRINPFAGRLARRLCERSGHYSNVFFACTGSDGVEAALKLARAATRRPRLLALERAYHGCAVGSVSMMHTGPFTKPFEPLLADVTRLPFNDVDALAKALAEGDVAALFVEPIQGEGGLRALSPAFIDAACELTQRYGSLLVADEVQTGFGRSGAFLRTTEWPRRPDAVILGKQLGGGLMPISALLSSRALFERAYGNDFEDGEAHNMTMGYNALGAVAALAALDLLTHELVESIAARGAHLLEALNRRLRESELFVEARGSGFMLGLELRQPDHPWLSFEQFGIPAWDGRPLIAPLLCARLYRRGYYCFPCGHDWSVVRIQPRFSIEDETLQAFVSAVREELARIEEVA
ncbi:MAG: aspartate aminotransferase family protein [Myxococcota bacterium]